MIAQLVGALVAAAYGAATTITKRVPLFYRIIFFALATYLTGCAYTVLYELLWQPAEAGFHVGYLGTMGMFFFLFSSYYGAMDSLVDGGQAELRKYRLAALTAALAFFAGALALALWLDRGLWLALVVAPMAATLYFAVKHLIIPDVEDGIIRVMRSYNAIVAAMCFCMVASLLVPDGPFGMAFAVCVGILLAACLPVARAGVRKWFI